MYEDKCGNYSLRKRDHALIALIQKKMSVQRKKSKTGVMQVALDHLAAYLKITEDDITAELNK